MHASSFAAEPFVMEHAGTVPHVSKADKHHSPVSLAQDDVPHIHGAALTTEALVRMQSGRSVAKQRQYSEYAEPHPTLPVERVLKRG